MQYALFDGQFRQFLLDATEFSVLKNWQKNPIKELSDFNESEHPYYIYYGAYLLNPEISDTNIDKKLKDMEGIRRFYD